ncbi:MAG: GerMN domain-containing protein [Candidatus Buchananbacteria bacterium]|nr:GerMN domain-containing protein [Candidatus Buchananbacteria bacterium]
MLHHKRIFFLGLILFSSFFVSGCFRQSKTDINQNNAAVTNSSVQPGEVAVLDSNIIVNKPLSFDQVTSPLMIQGRAVASLGEIQVRLLNALNNPMATTTITVNNSEVSFGSFSAELAFGTPTSPRGWLEVFSVNKDDGSVQNVIKLPIVFADYKNPTVKVFFTNIKEDPEVKDCSKVYPTVREIQFDVNPIAGALDQLLAGTTEEEMKNGFVDSLPEDVKVQKIELKDGVLNVDFDQALQAGVGGSCRVTAIRSQITETLKQFDTVKQVVISIDGETETILQP